MNKKLIQVLFFSFILIILLATTKTKLLSNTYASNPESHLVHSNVFKYLGDTIFTHVNITICDGDSIEIYGNIETETGDYLQIDDSDNPVHIETTHLTIYSPIEITIESEDPSCFGEQDGSIMISSNQENLSYSMNGTSYQNTPFFNQLGSGDYELFVSNSTGCQSNYTFTINETDELLVNLWDDIFIEMGQSTSVFCSVNSANIVDFQWTPSEGLSCQNCPVVTVSPFRTTNYAVIVTDENGCTAQDDITIHVDTVAQVFIPNVFSPNQDGTNDFFTIYGGNIVERITSVQIFNHKGGLVFESTHFPPNRQDYGWDGKLDGEPLTPNVFLYKVEVQLIDGRTEVFTGNVYLVR